MSTRVVLAVCLAWVVVAFIAAAQASLGSALMRAPNVAAVRMGVMMRAALIQGLPWIPVTLASIALTLRFPLGRSTWRRYIGVHLSATLLLAFLANLLIVLGYWLANARLQGLA